MIKFKKAHSLVTLVAVVSLALFAFSPSDKYFEIAKNLDIFATLFKEVNKYYVEEVDPTDLVNVGISSMLSTLDPYTNYIPEDQLDDYRTMTTGEYAGIGAVIGKRGERILVLMPNGGFAAHRAGLRIGDEILEIDGIPLKGKDVPDVSKLLKGEEGAALKLKVKKIDRPQPVDMIITRERIHIKNVSYFGMIDEVTGIIKLTDFTQHASREVKTALLELKKLGAAKVILDLRGNPGGLLSEAINVANVFLPRGLTVVETKGKIEEWNKSHRTLNQPVDTEIPLAVLIDNGSASAAEIVSGVIQDYDRGILVGSRSFGKGLVQQTVSLAYNAKLKITVAKYYIPSGRCIQEIDYSRRGEMGEAGPITSAQRSPFKTKAGRIVFDGGGIDPDVLPNHKNYAPITRSLLGKGLVFDYATVFYLKNPSIPPARDFKLTAKDFQDFKNWLRDKDYDYETRVERLLDDLVVSAKREQYYEDIKPQIYSLKQHFAHNKEQDLEKFKAEIMEELESEIATRYYLQDGEIEASFDDDPDIEEALRLLKDQQKYQRFLTASR